MDDKAFPAKKIILDEMKENSLKVKKNNSFWKQGKR